MKNEPGSEETLDPENWDDLRQLGHRMVDDMIDWLQTVRERPAWQPIPEKTKEQLQNQPLPGEPKDLAGVYEDFLSEVRPYPKGNIHPRFWGWVDGTGTVSGMFAEMLAAGMNSNVGFGEHSAVLVETQVIDWCKKIVGFPDEGSGILVSGGSMANLIGLAVARNAKADFNVAQKGLQSAAFGMVLYGSAETHSSVQKAVEILGLGNESFRRIAVDKEFRIDIAVLKAAITEDKKNGLNPFCVIGNAGTVNTGAIDDLKQLADLCEEENLWFHIDGAFGALAYLLDEFKPRLQGMERADSLAFDLHKWMYIPYEAGCILIRHADRHHQTFSPAGSYLSHLPRGVASGLWLSEYGLQLSRGFKALKIWMSVKEHGIDKYRRLIRQNIGQAQHLACLIEDSPELELLAPVGLNVVCFRFVNENSDEEKLNELNREILMQLHESGTAVPSYTTIKGKFGIRCAITNHRSRLEDFDILIDEVIKTGRKLTGL